MNTHQSRDEDSIERVVRVFRNGRSRAIRIPKEFEFAGDTVVMRQQPDGSILIRTATTAGLLDYLRDAEPWNGGVFVDDDDIMPPPDDVDLS